MGLSIRDCCSAVQTGFMQFASFLYPTSRVYFEWESIIDFMSNIVSSILDHSTEFCYYL